MTGAQEPRGRRLPRDRRISRGTEIRTLFQRGKRSRTPHLDVLVSDSPGSFSRVGVVVPRYGQTAVRRNTVKRRLREALRCEVLPRLEGHGRPRDVLVRARREAYGVPYAELAAELVRWTERLCARSS